jgi:hypothetical protein
MFKPPQSTVKMERERSSESVLLIYQVTRRHNPDIVLLIMTAI